VSLAPLSVLLGRSHDADAAAHQPQEMETPLKDLAKPTLKKRPGGQG
jgi:hypothetical protein